MNYKIALALLLISSQQAFSIEPQGNTRNTNFFTSPITLICLGSAAAVGLGCLISHLEKSAKADRQDRFEKFCSPINYQEERAIARKIQLGDQTFKQDLLTRVQTFGIQNNAEFPYSEYDRALASTSSASTSLYEEFASLPKTQTSMINCRSLTTDINRLRVHIRQQPEYLEERTRISEKEIKALQQRNQALEREVKQLKGDFKRHSATS